MASTLAEVAEEINDKLKIGIVRDGTPAKDFGGKRNPRCFLIRNGEVVASFVGWKSKDEVYQLLKENGVQPAVTRIALPAALNTPE
jgi:hypothetical protein